MKPFYLTSEDIDKILSREKIEPSAKLSKEDVEGLVEEYYKSKASDSGERSIRLYCLSQGAYDMFHEALKREFEKQILHGKSS